MNLIYYSSCTEDEPLLYQINEQLQLYSLEVKARFSLVALFEATRPEKVTIEHSLPDELIELLTQLSDQGKIAIVRAIAEEINLENSMCSRRR